MSYMGVESAILYTPHHVRHLVIYLVENLVLIAFSEFIITLKHLMKKPESPNKNCTQKKRNKKMHKKKFFFFFYNFQLFCLPKIIIIIMENGKNEKASKRTQS